MVEKKLPLRVGVGIVVLNDKNEVFVGKRKDNPVDKWQMPQGGVDKDESFVDAMRRELDEETNIKSIEIIKEIDKWFEYELPNNLLGKIWKGKYRGQKQRWFVVKFVGKIDEINIDTKCPEFIDWKWIKISELPKVIVSFKKNVYENLILELREFTN